MARPSTSPRPRVGLVLGAGGMLGGAWLAGALDALHDATGIRADECEVVVGTSAGSAIGALASTVVPPACLPAYACGGRLEGLDPSFTPPEDAEQLRDEAVAFRLARAVPVPGPGSLRMAVGTLARPLRHTPASVLAGWLPKGPVVTRGLRDGIAALTGEAFPEGDRLWVVTTDYASGRRTVFGRRDAPAAPLPDAVAASCSVPGFYQPVRIGHRLYVDGGVCSMSNLDLMAGLGLDLVVCLNPTSSLEGAPDRSVGGLVAAAMRRDSGRRLGHEAAKVRRAGTPVALFQPGAEECRAMGWNLMRRSGREEVAELAARNVLRAVRGDDEIRAALRSSGVAQMRRRPRATAPADTARAAERRRRAAA